MTKQRSLWIAAGLKCNVPLIISVSSVANPEIWNRGERKGMGRAWEEAVTLRRKFLKILCKNNAFSCKIFTCFKTNPVNKGAAVSVLESATEFHIDYSTVCRTWWYAQ